MFVIHYKQSFVTDVALNSSQTKNTVIQKCILQTEHFPDLVFCARVCMLVIIIHM